MLRAFVQVIDSVNDYDPPLVIHSGDVADKPVVSNRAMLQVQEGIKKLTVRADGSPRLVVVIAGNHDMPSNPSEPCYLEPALRPLSSVVVVTNKYQQVNLEDYVARGLAPAELRDVVVHCLPHDQLKRDDWSDVWPVPGKINILTSHGVVGGSELYKQCIGREYALPIDVVTRGWEYVAMGHWHKRGPVAVGGFKDATTPIWYAGSTEHCGFSDLQPGHSPRGYLQVQVAAGEVPVATEVDLDVRSMFRMPVLNAEGMTYQEITAELRRRIKATTLSGAVVDQTVTNVHRDTWSLVDVAAVKAAASSALWFQLTPRFSSGMSDGSETGAEKGARLGDIGAVLVETSQELFPDEAERASVMEMSRVLLGSALAAGPGPEDGDAEVSQSSSQPATAA